MRGPVFGKKRNPRSLASARPSRNRTSIDGSALPASIRDRYAWLTPADRATAACETPASSRSWRRSAPMRRIRRCLMSATRRSPTLSMSASTHERAQPPLIAPLRPFERFAMPRGHRRRSKHSLGPPMSTHGHGAGPGRARARPNICSKWRQVPILAVPWSRRIADPLAPFSPAVRAWFEATLRGARPPPRPSGWAAIASGQPHADPRPDRERQDPRRVPVVPRPAGRDPSPPPTREAPGHRPRPVRLAAQGADLRRRAQPARAARRASPSPPQRLGEPAPTSRSPAGPATRPPRTGASSPATRPTS